MDRIIKIVEGEAKASNGLTIPVRVELASFGYGCDVYVKTDFSIDNLELWDDDLFIHNVWEIIRTKGYTGNEYGRAELGMQGEDFIVLECGKDFEKFVIEKYGWISLSDTCITDFTKRCPWCRCVLPDKMQWMFACPECKKEIFSDDVFFPKNILTWDESIELIEQADALMYIDANSLLVYPEVETERFLLHNDATAQTWIFTEDDNKEVYINENGHLEFFEHDMDEESKDYREEIALLKIDKVPYKGKKRIWDE